MIVEDVISELKEQMGKRGQNDGKSMANKFTSVSVNTIQDTINMLMEQEHEIQRLTQALQNWEGR
jgi:hypothetical protein